MAMLTKKDKLAVITNEFTNEQLIDSARIVAEKSGCEDYLYENIEAYNSSLEKRKNSLPRKILWHATHKFALLTFGLCIMVFGLAFVLIFRAAFSYSAVMYVGAFLGIIIGFFVGSYIFPLKVNIKNCNTCSSLMSRKILYKYAVAKNKDIEKVNAYNGSTQRFENSAHYVETTVSIIITECKKCKQRSIEIVREKDIIV